MKTCVFLVVFSISAFLSVWGSPVIVAPSTTEIPGVVADSNATATTPIWLRFLKNKKVSTLPTTTELPLPVKLIPSGRPKPSGKVKLAKGPFVVTGPSNAEARRSVPTGNAPTNSLDEVLDKIAEYFHITPSPNGYLSGDAIAQDRQANPNTLYDQMYMDWIRKRQAEDVSQSQLTAPAAEAQPQETPEISQDPPQPPPSPATPQFAPYGYPQVPLGYSPFFPSLASFKLQKAMAQAQVDAAMAALAITTTPKPIKLKLKIQVPGLTNITQLGQITSALNANLPPGSTFELS